MKRDKRRWAEKEIPSSTALTFFLLLSTLRGDLLRVAIGGGMTQVCGGVHSHSPRALRDRAKGSETAHEAAPQCCGVGVSVDVALQALSTSGQSWVQNGCKLLGTIRG